MAEKKRKSKGATRRRQPLPIGKLIAGLTKVVMVVAVGFGTFFAAELVSRVHWQPLPVTTTELNDVLIYQDRAQVDQALAGYIGRSLLTLELTALQHQLESLDWIVSARLEKHWPGTLRIELDEHQPVAIWNEGRVLNSEGIPLSKPVAEMELPRLHGPDDKAADVMKQYLQFKRVFGEQNFELRQVTLHPRGAWTLTLAGGLEVALGEMQVIERSRRVLKVLSAPDYADLNIDYVDARYPNGIAIRLHETESTEVEDDIAA